MLTLFSIPKPFEGAIAEVQLNALRSWVAVGVQVVLVGDEAGVAEVAAELGAEHVPTVLRNERGTPRLDSAFAQVEAVARQPLRCFVNADIVLLDDFTPAAELVSRRYRRFLMIGRTYELAAVAPEELDDPASLRARALADGTRRGAAAIDYFVYTPGLFGELPPFLVGRAGFDNWLVWCARQGAPVVDASARVCAIHQAHDYAHLAGGMDEAYAGAEAAANVEHLGAKNRIYTIHDASHVLTAGGQIRRNYGATLRARETARKVAWKLGRR